MLKNTKSFTWQPRWNIIEHDQSRYFCRGPDDLCWALPPWAPLWWRGHRHVTIGKWFENDFLFLYQLVAIKDVTQFEFQFDNVRTSNVFSRFKMCRNFWFNHGRIRTSRLRYRHVYKLQPEQRLFTLWLERQTDKVQVVVWCRHITDFLLLFETH